MVELIRQRVSGATLLESVIAMSIIMLVFSMTMGVYIRVQSSGTTGFQRQINHRMNDMIRSGAISDNEEIQVYDSVSYHQLRLNYKKYKDLMFIEIRAEKSGKTLAVKRAVIKKNVMEDAK